MASLCGWVLLWTISMFIKNTKLTKIISELGRCTMPIVLFHFLAFKIVSYIYIILHGENKILLATYPVLEREWLWIAYFIVGTIIPLVFYNLSRYCKNKLVMNRGNTI